MTSQQLAAQIRVRLQISIRKIPCTVGAQSSEGASLENDQLVYSSSFVTHCILDPIPASEFMTNHSSLTRLRSLIRNSCLNASGKQLLSQYFHLSTTNLHIPQKDVKSGVGSVSDTSEDVVISTPSLFDQYILNPIRIAIQGGVTDTTGTGGGSAGGEMADTGPQGVTDLHLTAVLWPLKYIRKNYIRAKFQGEYTRLAEEELAQYDQRRKEVLLPTSAPGSGTGAISGPTGGDMPEVITDHDKVIAKIRLASSGIAAYPDAFLERWARLITTNKYDSLIIPPIGICEASDALGSRPTPRQVPASLVPVFVEPQYRTELLEHLALMRKRGNLNAMKTPIDAHLPTGRQTIGTVGRTTPPPQPAAPAPAPAIAIAVPMPVQAPDGS